MKRKLMQVAICVLFCSFCVMSSTYAQDSEEGNAEDEYTTTPLSLIELLGDEGFDELDWDFWTVVTQNNEPLVLIRSQIYSENDFLIFVEYEEIIGVEMNAFVWVYSLDGAFIEYRAWYRDRTRNRWDGDGDWAIWIRLNKDTVETLVLDLDGKHWRLRERELYENDSAIPSRWIPLAIKYHLTRGHERFFIESYRGVLPPRESINDVVRYQDVGVEEIDVIGELTPCHVIETWQSFWPRHHPDPDRSTPLVQYWAYESDGRLVFGHRHDLAESGNSEDRVDADSIPECFERFEVMIQGDVGEDVFGPIGATENERAASFAELAGENAGNDDDAE